MSLVASHIWLIASMSNSTHKETEMEKAGMQYTVAPSARVMEKSGGETVAHDDLLAADINIQALLDAGTIIAGKPVAGTGPVNTDEKKGSE